MQKNIKKKQKSKNDEEFEKKMAEEFKKFMKSHVEEIHCDECKKLLK